MLLYGNSLVLSSKYQTPITMKPTTIKIQIAEPCHENWDKMLAEKKASPDDSVGRGKFCLSCQKMVVDFSRMTNEEIIQYFEQNAGKSICGRIAKHQHNTPISNYRKVVTPWFNKYVAGFFMALGFYNPSSAQTNEVLYEQTTKGKIAVKPSAIGTKPVVINGRVLDAKTHKAIKGAIVTVDGTDIMATTDAKGNYTVTIPERYQTNNLVLTVVRENYSDASITGIDFTKTTVSVVTKLSTIEKPIEDHFIMGKMMPSKEN